MDKMDDKLIELLWLLLPGFVTAWVFFGLTAHARLGQFERLTQALIYTALVQAILAVVHWILAFFGRHVFRLADWTHSVDVVLSVAIALVLGVVLSYLANNNVIHGWLEGRNVTKKTSWPTNWYAILHNSERFVVLHLKDGRRIRGYPIYFPDYSDRDHFVLQYPAWISPDNMPIDLSGTHRFVVAACDVAWIEVMKFEKEMNPDEEATE
jgi:hypothetical protein